MSSKKHPLPRTMRGRPRWGGFHVPYFVAWYRDKRHVDEREPGAVPSFPTIDKDREALCRRRSYCWICGKKLGAFKAFVVGPLAALQRISSEPPSHRECAVYAVQVCPFMVGGHDMREDPIHEGQDVIEEMSPKNEQLNVIWICRDYTLTPLDPSRGMFIYQMGDPVGVLVYHRGQPATLAQTMERVRSAIIGNERIHNFLPNDTLARRVDQLLRYVGPTTGVDP